MVRSQTIITASKKKSKSRVQGKVKPKMTEKSSAITMSKDGRKYYYTEEEGLYQILE